MAWGEPLKTEVAKEPNPPKKRNPRKKAGSQASEALLKALNFVGGAVDTNSLSEFAKHVRISNGWVVAYDGQLAAGHPIEADFSACPHWGRLHHALNKAGNTLSLSLNDGGRLMVSSGPLRAVVPCLPPDTLPPAFPDAPIASIDDRLRVGFETVLKLAKDDAETVYESSVLLRANTVVGCNGSLSLEYWHGIDLPPGLAIPQRAAKMLAKLEGMVQFGFTWGRSATFHFEGGGWVRTQLYQDEWPNIDAALNVPAHNLVEIPELFDALSAIEAFSEDGAVHFHEGKLKSTYAASNDEGPVYGAAYDIPGLQPGTSLSAKLLKLAKPAAHLIDYQTNPEHVVFVNAADMVRGVLMKRR